MDVVQCPIQRTLQGEKLLCAVTGLSAIYMLFVTAMYKYRQICTPFGKQATQSVIMISCICGVVMSFIFATPAAVLWDVNNYTVTFENVTEHVFICEVHTQFHDSVYPALYRHFLSGYTIFLLATVILYIFVAKATIRHFRRLKRRSTPAVFDNPVFSIELTKGHNNDTGIHDYKDDKRRPNVPSTDNVQAKATTSTTLHSNQTERSQLTPSRIRKVAIMVIIAGVFSLTFFMAMAFGYVFAVRDYGDFRSTNDFVVFFCCYRFYFINYSLNPFVYFILDGKFRKQVKTLLTCSRLNSQPGTQS